MLQSPSFLGSIVAPIYGYAVLLSLRDLKLRHLLHFHLLLLLSPDRPSAISPMLAVFVLIDMEPYAGISEKYAHLAARIAFHFREPRSMGS